MAKSVVIAIFFLALGAFINTLGLILMKIGLISKKGDKAPPKSLIKNIRYLVGLSCITMAGFILVSNVSIFNMNRYIVNHRYDDCVIDILA